MQKRKKMMVISSALAIGLPLLAIGTKSILKKVRNDYYKNQKEQIEAKKAEEAKKLAQEKAKLEQKMLEAKSSANDETVIQKKSEKQRKIVIQKFQSKITENPKKVRITDTVQNHEPVSEPVTIVKRELTKQEIKQAKKALKEARASYYSGNKGPALAKNSTKNTDKIVIKTDGKGNIQVVTNQTVKNKNHKSEKIIQEIKDSYYKSKK